MRVYRVAGWSVIELRGEIDLQVLPHARRRIRGLTPFIVIDLSRVTFMDASGLRLLAQARLVSQEVDGCVRIVGSSRRVRRLLAMVLPTHSEPLFDSLSAATSVAPPGGRQGRPSPHCPVRGEGGGWRPR